LERRVREHLTENILREAQLNERVAEHLAALEIPSDEALVAEIRARWRSDPKRTGATIWMRMWTPSWPSENGNERREK
jgi:hypothetical protein